MSLGPGIDSGVSVHVGVNNTYGTFYPLDELWQGGKKLLNEMEYEYPSGPCFTSEITNSKSINDNSANRLMIDLSIINRGSNITNDTLCNE